MTSVCAYGRSAVKPVAQKSLGRRLPSSAQPPELLNSGRKESPSSNEKQSPLSLTKMKDSPSLPPNNASLATTCFLAIQAVASISVAPAFQAMLIALILVVAIAAALPIRQ